MLYVNCISTEKKAQIQPSHTLCKSPPWLSLHSSPHACPAWPLQPPSGLGLRLAFQKHLHLPKSTHCLSHWVVAAGAPNALFQPTAPPSPWLPLGISLARCHLLQEASHPGEVKCHPVGAHGLSFPYRSTGRCGVSACRKLQDGRNLCLFSILSAGTWYIFAG